MEAFYGLDGNELDIILHSPGGTPTAAEGVVDYLRSKYDDIRIFVPHAAMSAATMICCAADEVVMGKHSFLGPIDPQITLDTPTGLRSVPAQAILSQFNDAKMEIQEDESNLAHWTPILRQYGPGLLSECEQALNLSAELAEMWAKKYMLAGEPNAEEKADKLASTLSDWDIFKSHGRHISRDRASDFGFNVSALEDDQELQDIILSIYHIATHTHHMEDVAKIIENHEGNAYVSGLPNQGQPQGGSNAVRGGPSNFPIPPQGPSQEDVIDGNE
ncbi:SDH family Clp fold serine proteinase [Halobaculum rarum]|uniref:SDH family Clp fold serine proteinase n=1 Tax=Halobaculum rarum TaxID=3075122 RepID=UPI0032AFB4C1